MRNTALVNGREKLNIFKKNDSASSQLYSLKKYSNIPIYFLVYNGILYGVVGRVIRD